jgi:hypothetical protein
VPGRAGSEMAQIVQSGEKEIRVKSGMKYKSSSGDKQRVGAAHERTPRSILSDDDIWSSWTAGSNGLRMAEGA